MPKTKQQKKEMLESLIKKLEDSKAAVFAGFQGLTVNETETLRKTCRENNLEYLVAKKTLLKIALEKSGLKAEDKEIFSNEVAVVLSYADEVTAAKIVAKFAKDHEVVTLKGGILESKIIDLNMVKKLVSIPSKEELLAKLVGSINAPVSGFVTVLKGNLRGLVQTLNAIKEQKN
ncbi:50S ribosomal protein L10 [Candidatus Falkowbacteria bacterium]|jgi:large subunit ribosomal protein L10|nr:50S ribosomal protein L10 [Candidatus Falkowbacteria bacterium]MBT4433397.1 50S ribosomal protein L10 [Candidatus Falkowbacteria bacterium]